MVDAFNLCRSGLSGLQCYEGRSCSDEDSTEHAVHPPLGFGHLNSVGIQSGDTWVAHEGARILTDVREQDRLPSAATGGSALACRNPKLARLARSLGHGHRCRVRGRAAAGWGCPRCTCPYGRRRGGCHARSAACSQCETCPRSHPDRPQSGAHSPWSTTECDSSLWASDGTAEGPVGDGSRSASALRSMSDPEPTGDTHRACARVFGWRPPWGSAVPDIPDADSPDDNDQSTQRLACSCTGVEANTSDPDVLASHADAPLTPTGEADGRRALSSVTGPPAPGTED